MVRTLLLALIWPAILFLNTHPAHAGAYGELGTSLGKISNGNTYFGLASGAESSNSGFMGSFNFYVPITPTRFPVQFQLGLANRLTLVSITNPQNNLSMLTSNIALRFEIAVRFYIGGGYSPLNLRSTDGPLKLMNNAGSTSYFYEVGLIWRVVPELQIAATYSLEYGLAAAGGSRSPSPASEYGLRFRFPLFPYDSKNAVGSSFDGFRYPFGFMK